MREEDRSEQPQRRKGPQDPIGEALRFKKFLDQTDTPRTGDDAELLWLLGEMGETELAELVKEPMIARGVERAKRGLIYPCRRDLPQVGEIHLGTAWDGESTGSEVRLPLKSVLTHWHLAGRTGLGKSFLKLYILAQLIQHGVRVLDFDVEGEDAVLLNQFSRDQLWAIRPEWFPISLFRPPPGYDVEEWGKNVVWTARDVFYGREGFKSEFHNLLVEAYEELGSDRGSGRYPTLSYLLEKVKTRRFRTGKREWVETVKGRLEEMILSMGRVFDVDPGFPVEELVKRSVIINCRGMDPQILEWYVCTLIAATERVDEQP